MVKKTLFFTIFFVSCSTSLIKKTDVLLPFQPIAIPESKLIFCKSWEKSLNAQLTGLTFSRNGKRILVSTTQEQNSVRNLHSKIQFLNEDGKSLWSHFLQLPVKSLALSEDSHWISISTYEDSLEFFNQSGKKIWEKPGLGKPFILSDDQKVLFFNDDDADPQTAFVLYDFKGKKAKEVMVSSNHFLEPLEIFLSENKKQVSVSMPQGLLSIYDLEGTLLTQKQIQGEILAALLDSSESLTLQRSTENHQGASLWVYILSYGFEKTKQQNISAFKFENNIWSQGWTQNLKFSFETMKMGKNVLYLYGNSHQGQVIAAYDIHTGKEKWLHSYPNAALYSSNLVTYQNKEKVMALLETGDSTGQVHAIGLDEHGKAQWDLSLEAPDGVYAYSISEDGNTLVIGTGEPGSSILKYFKTQCP